jgi:hypothetical protein
MGAEDELHPYLFLFSHRTGKLFHIALYPLILERISQVASTAIKVLRTPVHAPRANAICARFLGSVRRECLDHVLILNERQHEPSPQSLCRLL